MGDGPWVLLDVTNHVSEVHVNVLKGLKKVVVAMGTRSLLLLSLCCRGGLRPSPRSPGETKLLLELLRCDFFGASKDKTLSKTVTAKFVKLDHLSISYETNESGGGDETEGELEGLLCQGGGGYGGERMGGGLKIGCW